MGEWLSGWAAPAAVVTERDNTQSAARGQDWPAYSDTQALGDKMRVAVVVDWAAAAVTVVVGWAAVARVVEVTWAATCGGGGCRHVLR